MFLVVYIFSPLLPHDARPPHDMYLSARVCLPDSCLCQSVSVQLNQHYTSISIFFPRLNRLSTSLISRAISHNIGTIALDARLSVYCFMVEQSCSFSRQYHLNLRLFLNVSFNNIMLLLARLLAHYW